MGTAAAAAPPKAQSPTPSQAMAQAGPDRPAAAMTAAELEAAIAALPAKKDALREAFDRLAACSPFPLPFTWEDLDAHISSLQSSISLRFRQLRVLEAARLAPALSAPAQTLDDGKAKNQDGEEEASEEEEWEEVEEVVEEVVEEADEEMQEPDDGMDKNNNEEAMKQADDKMGKDRKDEKETGEEKKEEVEEEEGPEEEEEVEEEEEIEEEEDIEEDEEIEDDKIGDKPEGAREEAAASEKEQQDADEEMQVADEEQSTKDDKKASRDKEEETYEELQDTDMNEAVAKKASAVQGKEEEEKDEEQEDHEEDQGARNPKKASLVKDKGDGDAKKLSQGQSNSAPPGSAKNLVKLAKSVCKSLTLGREFPLVVHHYPDAPALTVHAVKFFLYNKKAKTNKVWERCVTLIRSVPAAAAKPSADTIEQAKVLAKNWKEMIDKPENYGDLGVLASWGLFYFLISYNIVSEFDTNEIIHLFGTIPHKKQKKNTIELCKDLGLTDRITDLIDYLIGNGQQLDVFHLAHVFNLVDKYPPLSLLKDYVENAKQTAMEIFGKNMTRKSQNAVIAKEVANLCGAQRVVKQHISDSSQTRILVAEIEKLLHEYSKKRRGLTNAATASTVSNSQQQQPSSKKRKKEEQEHHKGQEGQQGKQSKPEEEQEQKQNEPQQKQQQQQKQENKPQEKQQENKPQEKRPRQSTPKRPKLVVPEVRNVARTGHFAHPPYPAMPGVHSYPAHPGWHGVQGAPFAPQFGAPPQCIRPFDPFFPHPQFYPR